MPRPGRVRAESISHSKLRSCTAGSRTAFQSSDGSCRSTSVRSTVEIASMSSRWCSARLSMAITWVPQWSR